MRVVLYSSITFVKGQTINSKYEIALLERLNDEIKKKRSHLKKKKVLVHQHNNAPVHKSIKTTAKLHELGYGLLPIHRFLQLWPPVAFFCLQTSKEYLLEI
jgi:hypothetical protein